MKRVLFVDDEGRILQGLRRMLRALRHEVELNFAQSGPEALERFEESPFDVLVTDMRMPGMNGAELLNEILARHPGTVRIVLSGQCDQETVLQCVGPAHQFLTKPCGSEVLKSTVVRACGVGEYAVIGTWKRDLSRLLSIPSLPENYENLVAEVGADRPSLDRISEIVSTDAGMAGKILQLVSSGFFGTPCRVAGLDSAVRLLGLDVFRALVRSTQAFVPLNVADSSRYEALMEHGWRVATAAKAVAGSVTEEKSVVNYAFLAGLLHNVAAMTPAAPRAEGDAETNDAPSDMLAIEPRSYAEATAYLLSLWGLPDSIVEPIGLHDTPGDSSDESFTALTAVHVADAIVSENVAARVDFDYLRRIGCDGRLDEWSDICRETLLVKVCQ